MDLHQQHGQRARLGREGVKAEQLRHKDKDQRIAGALHDIVPQKQLARVARGLVQVARADAAADDRDHGKAHGLADDTADAVEVVGDGVGRNVHGAEQADHADDQHAAELEQAVFERRRDADVQDVAHHARLQPPHAVPGDAGGVVMADSGQVKDDDRAQRAGEQRGHRHTGRAHLEHKDAQRVARNVGDVHQQADFHRDGAVARRAEDSRARIVRCQERVGQAGDREIDQRFAHDVVGDGAEEQPQQRFAQQKAERRHADAEQRAERDQLARAAGGFLRAARAEELAGDDRAAGGERRKDVDDEVVDHINERNARDGGFADAGDHDGVRHADENGERLLDDERPEQADEVAVGKQRRAHSRRGR